VLKYSHIANSIERNAQYTEHRTQGKAKSMQDILRNGEYKMVLTTAMGIHTYTDTHISWHIQRQTDKQTEKATTL